MKKVLLTGLLLTTITWSAAQNQYYQFSEFSQPYVELSNPIRIDTIRFAEGDFYFLPVEGETYTFFGVPFPMGGVKTFVLQSNGNLRIDNDSALVIIDGAFTFLDSIDGSSSVSYQIEGAGGNQLIKVQWKNLRFRVGDPGNFMNLQIWVYQATGVVEIHYGPSDQSTRSGFGTSDGPQVGMFFSRDNFSKIYEKLWVTGSPDAIKLDSALNFQFKAMSGIPEEGRVFRFEPRVLTGLPNAGTMEILLFPNPASNTLRITTALPGSVFRVYDAGGKLLLTEALNSDDSSIDISGLPSGFYTWTMENEGIIRKGKLLIRP